MPPAPKAPGARVRRNKDQSSWRGLPSEGRKGRPPKCPPEWEDTTKEWWKIIWRSPMATVWIESDIPALIRLGWLLEHPKPTALIVGEIRQIEDRFGLSPKSRRMLQWQIAPADEEPEAEQPLADVLRLRAVDPEAAVAAAAKRARPRSRKAV